MVKSLPARAGDARLMGLIPGSGEYPGEGHGNPLHNSCLGNPMDRGAWQATVYGVAELDTTEHTHTHTLYQEFLYQEFRELQENLFCSKSFN